MKEYNNRLQNMGYVMGVDMAKCCVLIIQAFRSRVAALGCAARQMAYNRTQGALLMASNKQYNSTL